MTTTLWMTAPYIAFTSFMLGHFWRYRTDQFGWTTRSSQIYESRLLRMGSPLFHFGILGVFGGHVVGLLIPETWTAAVGISEHIYHLIAVTAGSLAGFAVIAGLGILLYRRIAVPEVRQATTRIDKLTYLLLAAALLTGMLNTLTNVFDTYNYRETVSPWFRNLFTLHPAPELMAARSVHLPAARPGRPGVARASGRTPGWCTCSARRSATCSARLWSIAAGTRSAPVVTATPRRG